MSTKATKNLEPAERGLITKQLNHSCYYNKDLHTRKTAVQAYDLIHAAGQGGEPSGVAAGQGREPSGVEVTEPSSKVKSVQVRKSFTSMETKRVEAYLIEAGKTILKANAIQFVTDNPDIHTSKYKTNLASIINCHLTHIIIWCLLIVIDCVNIVALKCLSKYALTY